MKIAKHRGLMLAVLVSIAGWVEAGVIEKPITLPGAMVSITVSDLHGFIDGAGEVASQVSPMANGMMIKSLVGMQIGDPSLSGIAPGKGLAVVAIDATNVFAVVEVSEAQLATYTNVLSSKGIPSQYSDGVLVVAQDAARVAKGTGMVSAVKETLLSKRSPSLRMTAQPAALIEKNKARIDGMIQMMPMMMGMGMTQGSPGMDADTAQGMARLVEGELRVLLSIAEQCETAEIVLTPVGSSLQISKTFSAKPGSRLATLLGAPKVNQPNPKIQSGRVGEAAIAVDCTLGNPEALTTYLNDEVNLLLKAMGLQSEDIAGWDKMMTRSMEFFRGSFSETLNFGGGNFMNINYVMDVKDDAAALDYLKSCMTDMAPILNLYKKMGMPMTIDLKENSREHSGIKIHQFKVGVTMPQEQLAGAQAMNMDLSNMVFDVAICDGLVLYAMGETSIETLVDRVKDDSFKPAPLKARSVYPANGFYYCDVDVAKYISGIGSIMPQEPYNPLPQVAALLQGADPVTSAGYSENGMVMWSVNVPGSLLARIGQAVMTMQMQQMQKMQSAPPDAMPVDEPADGPAAMPAE